MYTVVVPVLLVHIFLGDNDNNKEMQNFHSVTRDVDLVEIYQLRVYDELDPLRLSTITNCNFFKILQMFAAEAGFTLSTLYKMDKIRDVRVHIGSQGKNKCQNRNAIRTPNGPILSDNLYKTFLDQLFDKLPTVPRSNVNLPIVEAEPVSQKPSAYPIEKIENFRQEFAQNPFFFLFEKQLKQMESSGQANNRYIYQSSDADKNDLFERLKPKTEFILPYDHYFRAILTNLLQARISVANDYVLGIYKNEHQLVHHLKNLSKIYFMEAGDLLCDFYSKLFTQVSYNQLDKVCVEWSIGRLN